MSQNQPVYQQSSGANGTFAVGAHDDTVPVADRRREVLKFLVESQLALPRKVIYRNLKYRGATFSESSVKNYLRQLRERNLIERVDPELLADGELEPSDGRAGYYVPTQKGQDLVAELPEDREPVLD